MDQTVRIAQDPDADALLGRSPLAAMVGMLLDQQVPMEWAFSGPHTLLERLGGDDLDAGRIAAMDPDEFSDLCARKPAIHRYPGSMAKRVQQLCRHLVEHYDGDAAAVWRTADTGEELLSRLRELPGYGEQKARIFVALLGKRLGVRPSGWREAAGDYGKDGAYLSAADITGPETLARVREHKQEMKRAAKEAKSTGSSGGGGGAGKRATRTR